MPRVFISGTGQGIGAEIASHFLQKGWEVSGCSRGEAAFTHPGYTHYASDLALPAARRSMLEELIRKDEAFDALVLNAAIAHQGPALLTPPEVHAQLMEVNYLAQVEIIQALSRKMLRRRSGSVIVMGSVAEGLSIPLEAAYAASKAAITQYAKVLARELSPSNISVHVIAPGPVDTRLMKNVPDERVRYVTERQVNQAWTSMEQILSTVDICTGPQAMAYTGQVFYLNGI